MSINGTNKNQEFTKELGVVNVLSSTYVPKEKQDKFIEPFAKLQYCHSERSEES